MLLGAILGHAAVAGMTSGIDTRILVALRQPGDTVALRGPSWLFAAMRDITALGDTPVLTLVTMVAAGFALIRRRIGVAVFIALTIGGGAWVNTQLKLLFARPRPSVVPHLVDVTSASFPSGHAMNSAIACLTLAALLIAGTRARGVRAYVALVAIALTILIGVSRLCLGVHYPSDVIGGWIFASAWVTACWQLAARWLPLPGRGEALPLAAQPAKARQP